MPVKDLIVAASQTSDAVAGIVRKAERARDKMRQWFPMFEELAVFFYNIRQGFLTEHAPGQELDMEIWDSAPEGHRARLAQAFVDAACPKDRYWVGIAPVRPELMLIDRVRIWCQMAAYYMYLVINDPDANFSESLNELADDQSTFGTGIMYIDHDRKERHLCFQVKHLKHFAFDVDANGKLTCCYCWWDMKLEDLVERFGLDALPDELQTLYRKPSEGADRCYEVIHAVLPSAQYQRFGFAFGRLPYQSLWILKKGNHQLDAQGYYEMPYILTRWYRRSGEALGRCDAMRALSDARLMQSVAQALLEITEKQGNPPMQMPIDLIRGDVELWPGGANFFDASGFQFQGDPIRPIQLGANPAMTAEYLQYLDKKIGRIFFHDLLSLPEEGMDPQQHMGLEMMKAQILAPLWTRVENETLPPILDRVFNIMMRNRALPPVPPELVGEQLIYKLDNKIADMRELAKAQSSFEAVAQPLALEREEAVDNIDWDTAFRDLYRMRKVPETWIRPMQDVMADRQQRQQEMQMAKMAELAKAGGPGVKSAIEGAVQARDQGLLPAPQ